MSKTRLQPIEFNDLSGGRDRFFSQSLVPSNKLSDGNNLRHIGPGKIRRRDGEKRYANADVTAPQQFPATPDIITEFGRLCIPYLRKVIDSGSSRFRLVESVFSVRHDLYSALEDSVADPPVKILTVDDASLYTKGGSKVLSQLNFDSNPSDNSRDVAGFGFLRDRIYVASSFSLKAGETFPVSSMPFAETEYPFGFLLEINDVSGLSLNDEIEGNTTGAKGFIGFIDVANDILHLWGWNGQLFDIVPTVETIKVNGVNDVTKSVVEQNEFGLPGVILEFDETVETAAFKGRRWGILKPQSNLTAAEEVDAAGVVEADAYRIRFTYIRVVGATLSGGDNPKLVGGEIISESAPTAFQTVVIAVGTKQIKYTLWPTSDDPQVTHVRIYRDDGSDAASDFDFHHVADGVISAGVAGLIDNFPKLTIQLEPITIDTGGLKIFGEDGENSGFAVETGNFRVFVGGNPRFPQRIWASKPTIVGKFSEYFFTSLDITESPGESVMALKWFARRMYVFMERSVYEIREASTSELGLDSYRLVTRQLGCAARHGVLDMGNFMVVMSEIGLVVFDGTNFSKKPLTLGVDDVMGNNFLNAKLTRTDELIIIITDTLRTNNQMVTIKHSDGTFALGVDVIDVKTKVPTSIGFLPDLTNFNGSTGQDSNYALALVKRVVSGSPDVVKYDFVKYDLAGQDFDHVNFDASAGDDLPIVAEISPRVIDFGAFTEARLETLILFAIITGATDGQDQQPTGEWLVRIFIDQARDGTAAAYFEALLKPVHDKGTEDLPSSPGGNVDEPIQPRYTKHFATGSPSNIDKQTGGVYGPSGLNPASLFASKHQIFFRADFNQNSLGRLFKIILQYKSKKQFEFTSAAFRFVEDVER